MLASGHPGLEIKVLYYILCTALSSQVQTNTATCRGRTHVNNVLSQTCELTYVIGHVNVCLHLWKLATWRFECRGFTVFLLLIQKRWELQGLPFWLLLEVWMPKSNLSCLSLYPRQPSPVCVCVCVCVCVYARARMQEHTRTQSCPTLCDPYGL